MEKHRIEIFFAKYKHTTQVLIFCITALSIFFLLSEYLDNKIEKRITNQVYINNLSKYIRPFLIFNDKEIIEYDHGASNYVSDIKFNKKFDIVDIFFTKHLQNEPLLITIGDIQYSYKSERIKNNGWRFSLHSSTIQDVSGDKSKNKYILEILP